MRGQIGFVDYQDVRFGDSWTTLAWDFFARSDVDDIKGDVSQFGAEGGREVVATALDQHDFNLWMAGLHLGDSGQIDRGILANSGVRASARFNADDTIQRQNLLAHQRLCVFARVNVIGDDTDRELIAQCLTKSGSKRGFPRAHRTANPYTQGAIHWCHERNILEYWVSCFIDEMSDRKAVEFSSSRSQAIAVSAILIQVGIRSRIRD